MRPSGIERRIFVVGVPRSGTTLVQSLLAAHGAVTSFTESHFFSRHFRALPRLASAVLTRDPVPRLREFLVENGVEPSVAAELEERVAGAVPASLLLPLRTRAVARLLLRVLDELALSRGRSSWVEKTPRHLRYVPFLERLSGPGSHFVHVVRDGLETVASLHAASQRWERPYDLETCVRRWNADVAFSLSRAGGKGGGDCFVLYERLTSDPEATLERLFAGLGLERQPEVLDRFGSSGLITREETWKAGVDRGVRPSGTSEQVLTEAQRARVRASLRHDLYERLLERTS